MSTSTVQQTGAGPAPPPPAAPPAHGGASKGGHGLSFHDILSAINPLQYLPVVGTIYRAITGDTIAEPVRQAGSMVVSGLLGGPIGLIGNIATTLASKITGIDPEKIAASIFHTAPAATIAPADGTTDILTAVTTTEPAAPRSLALSAAQLAAYGVQTDNAGNLTMGKISGADVLNALELVRHGNAATAYAENMALPSRSREQV